MAKQTLQAVADVEVSGDVFSSLQSIQRHGSELRGLREGKTELQNPAGGGLDEVKAVREISDESLSPGRKD